MSTAAIALSNRRIERSPSHTATIYLKEAKYEFLKNLRLRMRPDSPLTVAWDGYKLSARAQCPHLHTLSRR